MDDLISMHEANNIDIKIIEEDSKFIVIKDDVIEKIGPGWLKEQ
nr:hypothetical protein [Mucilaginibacter sp. Bleaf8]